MGSFACDLHIISESLGKQWWLFAALQARPCLDFVASHQNPHTWKKFQVSERKKRAVQEKTLFCCALGVCKSGSPLAGRKGTGMGSLFLWDHLICRMDNDESDTFEDGVGFDVPPAPYVTSQTQNTFWIHPFYLLRKCQHWFNSQFLNLCGKMNRSLPMPSVAE